MKTTSNGKAARTDREGKYCSKTVADILADIALGFCVKDACENAKIHPATWYKWMIRDAGLGERYARAKELMAEQMAQEILAIADDQGADWQPGAHGDVGNRAAVDRSRLKVDTRKWLLSKLIPKKYGELVKIAGDSEAPVVMRWMQPKEKTK